MKLSATFALLLASAFAASAAVTDGQLSLSDADLQPGARIQLNGEWFYKPGYAVGAEEKPETETNETGYFRVAVPQFLNRVRWWLDDSEDFTKHETERLKKLGFDTDKAEEGWYRLPVDLPEMPKGRRFFLQFDGVAMKCQVYCNGHLLGGHQGMFSRFSFDLTDSLHAGRNLVAVYVSMEKFKFAAGGMGEAVTVNLTGSKVKSMSKGMYGPLWPDPNPRSYDLHGIWQPVTLTVCDDAKIDDVWFVPSLRGGTLQVSAHNFGAESLTIAAEWVDNKTGAVLARLNSQKVGAGLGALSNAFKLAHVHPKLWTPADPNLYRLCITLKRGSQELDQWNGKVGFRTFEVRGNKFFLNGHPWWLRGADHLPYGKNPWDPALARKLIQLLHDANLGITRTHGTPWNEAWLDAADEIGLGVSVEGIRPWALAGKIGPTPPDMFQHWLMENQDVIERCRNHPSVLIYTVGNEMLLRDTKNVEKWKQLSDVVKQTRRMDPTRPVIASSEYARDPEFYQKELKPNGVDDGDIDDLHRYNNWYGPSSFVTDSKMESEMKRNRGTRPLMGQEMSTGYPDLDAGLPMFRYTDNLLTPQAWIGNDAYFGSDPAVFLEHHRAVTKRWAEQLRFQRSTNTAGFMLFAAECWFSHSYDPQTVSPYPVYDSIREADAPIGLALETGRRRFFSGEKIETAVFISNDDDHFRNLANLDLEVEFSDGAYRTIGHVKRLPYFSTVRVPVTFTVPAANDARAKLEMRLLLRQKGKLIGETTDPIVVFPQPQLSESLESIISQVAGNHRGDVILLPTNAPRDSLKPGSPMLQRITNGATAIWFAPGTNVSKLFPEAVRESKKVVAEYADFSPVAGTPLARGLQPMDLKWWGRTNDWRTFIGSEAERLRDGGPARKLIRYIPPHGYIASTNIPEQQLTVMWELRMGQGRLWVCDLDLEKCVGVDPAARLFAENLFRAAADPDSTGALPHVPTHEEFLKRKRPE